MKVSGLMLVAGLVGSVPQHGWALERREKHEPGDLSVEVFVTDSTTAFAEWMKPPSAGGPVLRRIHEAKFDQLVHGGFLVTGYMVDPTGKVKFAVDVRVRDPHGQVIFEEQNWAVHDGYAGVRGIIMAKNILDFAVESGDPAGAYRIEAVVRDLISHQQAEGVFQIQVGP